MKIQVLSDLHLEGGVPNFLHHFEPVGDVVVLPGDITNARNVHLLVRVFGSCKVPVLYVPGNHEYYGHRWDDAIEYFRIMLAKETHNIRLLNDEAQIVDGVQFIGSTYWSDVSVMDELDVGRFIADYRAIQFATVSKQRAAHYKAKDFIKFATEEANQMGIEKRVVITHFPPSWQAQEERFKNSGLGSYFYNNDDEFVELIDPDLWIYGHTHGNLNFNIGTVPVISNQMGYLGELTNKSFKQNYVYEI
jgi:Icc-related predicted phosphoesterase